MRNKVILASLLILSLTTISVFSCGFTFFKKTEKQTQKTTIENFSNKNNDVWCITFQLIWNDFMDKFNKGEPIKFIGSNPALVDELNKKEYTKELLSEKDYYTVNDKISKKLKKEIEKNIKKKFNEKSDVLKFVDWNAKNSYLFYSILKKDFKFATPFDKLDNRKFNNSEKLVKYFGIDKNSDKRLYQNVEVISYKGENEYAVKLYTKENEEVILYRTDRTGSLDELYSWVYRTRERANYYNENDTLTIPNINVDKLISYNELCGRKIENSDYVISQALQTIKFKLNNEGGKLKSEAIMTVMKTSLMPDFIEKRNFSFDKPFALFLKEAGKDKPYYAMYIDDTKYLEIED